MKIKLNSTSVEVGLEVEAELGNYQLVCGFSWKWLGTFKPNAPSGRYSLKSTFPGRASSHIFVASSHLFVASSQIFVASSHIFVASSHIFVASMMA